MKRLNPVMALFSFNGMPAKSSRQSSTTMTTKRKAVNPMPQQTEGYIDGYTYRKLASPTQAAKAIQEFYREFVGQENCSDEVMGYVQQWNNGRSLRSIRDEIARCPRAQCWG